MKKGLLLVLCAIMALNVAISLSIAEEKRDPVSNTAVKAVETVAETGKNLVETVAKPVTATADGENPVSETAMSAVTTTATTATNLVETVNPTAEELTATETVGEKVEETSKKVI